MSTLLLIILALIPSLFWLLFYLRKDYQEPEPRKLLLKIFLLGVILSFPIAFFAEFLATLYQVTTPEGTAQKLWLSFIIMIGVIAPIEEFTKYWVAKTIANRNKRYFTQVVDGIIYMAVAAAAFAFVENFGYFLGARLETQALGLSSVFSWAAVTGNFAARFIGATLLHLAASGVFGYFWGISWFKPEHEKTRPFLTGFGIAVLLHGVFNFSLLATQITNFEFYPLALIVAVAGTIFALHKFKGSESVLIHQVPGNEAGALPPEKPKNTTLVFIALSILVVLAGGIAFAGIGSRLTQTTFIYSVITFSWPIDGQAAIHPVIVTQATTMRECEIIRNIDTKEFSELFSDVRGTCDGSKQANDLYADQFHDLPTQNIYLSFVDDERGQPTRIGLRDKLQPAAEEKILLTIKKALEENGITEITVVYPVNFTASTPSPTPITADELSAACSRKYGPSTYDGNYCVCQTGYTWSADGSRCITNSESCAAKWPNSYWTGQYDQQGKFLCDCQPGYTMNSAQTACQ